MDFSIQDVSDKYQLKMDSTYPIELNKNRVGLPFKNSDSQEELGTVVISASEGQFSYAKRQDNFIVVTTVKENMEYTYTFSHSEIDILHNFSVRIQDDSFRKEKEAVYPDELVSLENRKEIEDQLLSRYNIDIHSPSLYLERVTDVVGNESLKTGSVYILTDSKYDLREGRIDKTNTSTNGSIYEAISTNRLNPVVRKHYLPRTSMKYADLFNEALSKGLNLYLVKPHGAESINTSIRSKNPEVFEEYIAPSNYRSQLSAINGDENIRKEIADAISFSESFKKVCSSIKKEFKENFGSGYTSKDYRSMLSDMTKLDLNIKEALNNYANYTKKVNEKADPFLVNLERKKVDQNLRDLKNLVLDLDKYSYEV